MKRCIALVLFTMSLTACSSRLTFYDLKANVGQTEYDTGARALYTGASVGAHFEVK